MACPQSVQRSGGAFANTICRPVRAGHERPKQVVHGAVRVGRAAAPRWRAGSLMLAPVAPDRGSLGVTAGKLGRTGRNEAVEASHRFMLGVRLPRGAILFDVTPRTSHRAASPFIAVRQQSLTKPSVSSFWKPSRLYRTKYLKKRVPGG